ncbi:MAG: hypothetical protein K0R78_493 [Pelosinus sp.]|jgi:type II secretory pathway pseudopilin PulG|nr:hypothetical protein [Pelosinus sp.]
MIAGRGQKGFILMDSLVGIIILTVALLAILLTYSQATITAVSARNYNNAVYLAQQTVEELKRNNGRTEFDPSVGPPVTIKGIQYTIDLTRLTIPEVQTNTNLRQYKVTVTWAERINSKVINRNVELVDYYYSAPQGWTL